MHSAHLISAESSFTDAATIFLTVVDRHGRPVLANVFISGQHESGRLTSEFQYLKSRRVYRLRLEQGDWTINVSAAGFEDASASVRLSSGRVENVTFQLQTTSRDFLLLPLPEGHALADTEDIGPVTRLLALLSRNPLVLEAMGSSLEVNPHAETIALHFALRLAKLGFPTDGPDTLAAYWRLVANRTRLAATFIAILSNPAMAHLIGLPQECDVRGAVLRSFDALDVPEIRQVLDLLAAAQEPWRQTLDAVVASQVSVSEIALPPGIAQLMRRNPAASVPAPHYLRLGGTPLRGREAGRKLNELLTAFFDHAHTRLLPTVDEGPAAFDCSKLDKAPSAAPSTLTILGTYHCTAACTNCCFGSHPGVSEKLSLGKILDAIEEASKIPSFRSVVFSGGECFTLEEELIIAVARCTERGLGTRCVTNGYWARTVELAKQRLRPLLNAGLDELNLSTGDMHLRYVPADRIVNAAIAAIGLGLRTVVVVEIREGRAASARSFLDDPRVAAIKSSQMFKIIESPWISMQDAAAVAQDPDRVTNRRSMYARKPCDSVLDTIVLTPRNEVGACCGLTREQIPELRLGGLDRQTMAGLVGDASKDLMKLWLSLEGPERILSWSATVDPSIEWEDRFAHPCDACRALYQDPKVRQAIRTQGHTKRNDLLVRQALIEEMDVRQT